MLKIIEKTKIWFSISLIIIIIGLSFVCTKGLDFDIDFKGGTIITINMEKKFNKTDVDKIIKKYAPDAVTNISGTTDLDIKCKEMKQDDIDKMYKEIKDKYSLTKSSPASQDSIGASFGNEMKKNAILAVIISGIAMLIYVGIRFEFKFGAAAILALIHDLLITTAVYAVFQIPVGSGFVAAMLTVIGYSINDTIVVFDRIRENQKYVKRNDIVKLANGSLTQTMARSINTVLTVLVALTCVHIMVPSIRDFTTPLLVGIVSGCYSSIFIATPLWVIFKKAGIKHKNHLKIENAKPVIENVINNDVVLDSKIKPKDAVSKNVVTKTKKKKQR